MKRIFAFLLALAMIFTLCACGKKEEASKKEQKEEQVKHVVREEDLQEMSFEPFAVFSGSDYTVKVNGVTIDYYNCCSVQVEILNKSDEDLLFAVISGAVNYLQSDPFMAIEVKAGDSTEQSIYFSDMNDKGIKYFTDIELDFCVYSAYDTLTDPLEEKTVHIYPYGKENTLVFEYEPSADDSVLFNNDVASAIIVGFDENSLWGYSLSMLYENKTDKDIDLSVSSSYINGIEVDPLYNISISAQNSAFDCLSWFQSDLSAAGITEINSIVLEFVARDAKSGDQLMEKEVTINFD